MWTALKAKGVNFNYKDFEGQTLLMIAVKWENEAANFLIAEGGND